MCSDERRTPLHRVALEVAGEKKYAYHLVSIDGDNKGSRDTFVFTKPEEVLALLPPHVRQEWAEFSSNIHNLGTDWGLQGVPTLKRILRLYRKGEILQSFEVATIAHHYGAVPALVIDRIDGTKIALLSERFGHGFFHGEPKEEEALEILQSLDQFLPALFKAYYEQIANYLMAVFFTADEKRALSFCLRVRELITRSIRGKLELVEERNYKHPATAALANEIRQNYRPQLIEGRAVDALGHLIVNYIYGFFSLNNRALDYSERLQRLPSEHDIYGPSPLALLKSCGENIIDPDDDGVFLESLTGTSRPAEKWLRDFLHVGAFVAEVVRSTRNERLDSPRIFVTYHFEVKDSEDFFEKTSAQLRSKGAAARIVRGRHIGPNVRWSVLARLWLSDYHVLFLPRSFQKREGGIKYLKDVNNWVNLELLYGQLIQRELKVVVGDENSTADFSEHLQRYTDEKEIEQIDKGDWDRFVPGAKQHLQEILKTHRHVQWVPDRPEDFWLEFKSQVLEPAGRKLIHVLFHAWCYYFNPVDWSVVQAILMLNEGGDLETHVTADQLADFIWSNRTDRRFDWALPQTNKKSKRKSRAVVAVAKDETDVAPKSLRRKIRGKLSELAEFEYSLYEGGSFPILSIVKKAPLTVRVRINSLYKLLTKKFDLVADDRELLRIVNALREVRLA